MTIDKAPHKACAGMSRWESSRCDMRSRSFTTKTHAPHKRVSPRHERRPATSTVGCRLLRPAQDNLAVAAPLHGDAAFSLEHTHQRLDLIQRERSAEAARSEVRVG